MTTINNSTTTSTPLISSSSSDVCLRDDPSTSTAATTATGVTAVQDGFDGVSNASSYTATGASALTLRNEGLLSILDKADNVDDVAGARSFLTRYNTGLSVIGAAANGLSQGLNSDATTTTGQVVTGVGTAGLSFAASGLHPGVTALDLATGGAVSQNLNNGISAPVTIVDGLVTGDSEGMENLHQRNLDGENGPIAREAAESGDFWAKHGIRGGLGALYSSIVD